MRLYRKVLISIIGISVFFMITNSNSVNAALQANGNASKTDNISNWLLNIRKMEATGGTLGLNDSINTTNLTSSASQSNNIDIHMEKNTEYGSMAILSASAYGNQNKVESGQTTTGNKSGVHINLNNEWVAAGQLGKTEVYTNASAKYKNYYTPTYAAKVGDAISETAGWHGSDSSTWLRSSWSSGLVRAHVSSLFEYYGYGDNGHGDAYYTRVWSSRAVIVVGEGF